MRPLISRGRNSETPKVLHMAKAVTIKVKLVSSADTGFYYVAKKNSRTMTDKLVKKKYDPVARKHVEFRKVQDQVGLARCCRNERGLRAPFLFGGVLLGRDIPQIIGGGSGICCRSMRRTGAPDQSSRHIVEICACSRFPFSYGLCWEPRLRAPP